LIFGGSDATTIPEGTSNGTFFDGAVLAIVVRRSSHTSAKGTGVMVAPGLAISATQIVRELLDDILGGTVALLAVGPADRGLDNFHVRKLSISSDSDITYMSVELASAVSADCRLRTLPMTTTSPRLGKRVHVVGFHLDTFSLDGDDLSLTGNLYTAAGAVHLPMRDRVLMPFPTIEVACGSIGGMSGGALLDETGFLLGVTSRGLTSEDGLGSTFAARVVGALNRELEIPWPPSLYPQPVHLLDIDQRLLFHRGPRSREGCAREPGRARALVRSIEEWQLASR
jgi:hypothetical protein